MFILLVAGMGLSMRLYSVQEILVVLLLLAASAVTVFVSAVAFILFQEGIRRCLLWAKAGIARLAGFLRTDCGLSSVEGGQIRLAGLKGFDHANWPKTQRTPRSQKPQPRRH
jgi:hypothetical protein